jgi:hypothetical protein
MIPHDLQASSGYHVTRHSYVGCREMSTAIIISSVTNAYRIWLVLPSCARGEVQCIITIWLARLSGARLVVVSGAVVQLGDCWRLLMLVLRQLVVVGSVVLSLRQQSSRGGWQPG